VFSCPAGPAAPAKAGLIGRHGGETSATGATVKSPFPHIRCDTTGKGGHLKVTLNGKRSALPMGSGELKKGTQEGIKKQLGLKE
jgi:hypothetical protein